MTFIDDLDQIRNLSAEIAEDTRLPLNAVHKPDLADLLAKLSSAGLTNSSQDSGESNSLEVLAANIGAQVGLASVGIIFPIAEFDLFPNRLASSADISSALTSRTLLTSCVDVERGHPVGWATYADGFLLHRKAPTGTEIAMIHEYQLTEPTTLIDGSPAAIIVPQSTPNWTPVSDTDFDWVVQVRRAIALAVAASQLAEVVNIIVSYASERTQFGRPIGRFQAVQQLVSQCATQSEMVAASSSRALLHLSSGNSQTNTSKLEIAAACLASYNAVEITVRNAHQAIGAIGTTLEHDLQRYTRGLLQNRRQMDTYTELSDELSELITSENASAWEVITA
jgi:acyl-CoA dehydrogenase